jgi:hypothetical protein
VARLRSGGKDKLLASLSICFVPSHINSIFTINTLIMYLSCNKISKKNVIQFNNKPEALKSLYRSPGNKKNQLVLCKNYVLRHLGITINIKNTKFVKDLPMIDAQFRFNQCNSFREEYISVFSPYGSVLIL